MPFKSHLSSRKVAVISPWTSVSYMAVILVIQAPEVESQASEKNRQNNSEPKKSTEYKNRTCCSRDSSSALSYPLIWAILAEESVSYGSLTRIKLKVQLGFSVTGSFGYSLQSYNDSDILGTVFLS